MKRKIVISILLISAILLTTACKRKQKSPANEETIELNEQTLTEFAHQIVESVYNGHPEIFNQAVDQEHIKSLVTENSIVYSGFDVEGGQKYFEECLKMGNLAVETVNNGGSFSFVKHYQKNGKNHLIFRTYNDFIVNFLDCIMDTVGGKLKICDAFIYNTGALLSKNVEYSMLYNLMLQTNPESEVQWMQKAEMQTKNGQYAQAISTLNAHKEALKAYPLFYQIYIANLYRTHHKNFVNQLELLKGEIDERYLLLHKLLFFCNEGDPKEAENVINQLIPHTGDDPIYLLLYARAEMLAGNYQNALTCLQTASEAMSIFWDLWACEMKCYRKLNDTQGFSTCLQRGKEAFGITDQEVEEILK